MGISCTTYIGPYVSCKTHLVDETRTKRTCSNEKCNKYESEIGTKNFCDTCGAPIESREYTVEVANVDRHEVGEQLLSQALTTPWGDYMSLWMKNTNQHIWLANGSIPNQVRKLSHDAKSDEYTFPVDQELITAELNLFSDRFEKEIELLRQEYGPFNVSLHWGVVHYMH